MLDVGFPFAAVFDAMFRRDAVAKLDARVTVEAEVGLLVPVVAAMGVGWDVAVDMG